MSPIPDVWQEVQVNDDGLSVTTYVQQLNHEPTVADESYWTWDEITHMMIKHRDDEVIR